MQDNGTPPPHDSFRQTPVQNTHTFRDFLSLSLSASASASRLQNFKDQLSLIFNAVGSPKPHEVAHIRNPEAIRFLESMRDRVKVTIKSSLKVCRRYAKQIDHDLDHYLDHLDPNLSL